VERTAVLILGHGSRRAEANAEFEALVGAYRARRPALDVRHAYIELAEPLLADGLAAAAGGGPGRVALLPLFLFAAGHVKQDVPRALAATRRAFPGVALSSARALGVCAPMVELALERAAAAVAPGGEEAARTTLLVVGRGASDPDANGDLCKLVRLVGEAGGFGRSEPSFIAITGPRFAEAAERALATSAGPLLVLPYFLFDGLLVRQLAGEVAALRARHPARDVRLAPHLGPDPRLLGLLDERLAELLAAAPAAASGGRGEGASA
jgi:sirohydrochlorin ferrochelatase